MRRAASVLRCACSPCRWPQLSVLAAFFALLALLVNRSGGDAALARLSFDAAHRVFPWRDAWWAVVVLHDGAHRLAWVVWAGVAAGALLARWRAGWQAAAAPLAFIAITSACAAGAVALMKAGSMHSCPWDLQDFGGTGTGFGLLGTVPANPGPGRCLPGGHASVGWMWLAVVPALARWPQAFAWLSRRWRVGLFIGWAVFTLATSTVQLLRGAHFLSHVLLTAAVCAAVAALCDALLQLRDWARAAAGHPQTPGLDAGRSRCRGVQA